MMANKIFNRVTPPLAILGLGWLSHCPPLLFQGLHLPPCKINFKKTLLQEQYLLCKICSGNTVIVNSNTSHSLAWRFLFLWSFLTLDLLKGLHPLLLVTLNLLFQFRHLGFQDFHLCFQCSIFHFISFTHATVFRDFLIKLQRWKWWIIYWS